MNGQPIAFDRLLPELAASYRKGELVPFIGAGMSRLACAGWEDLILGLEKRAGEPGDRAEKCRDVAPEKCKKTPTPSDLIRRADRAVKRLLTRGESCLQEACRAAVVDEKHGKAAPPQTAALGKTSWSLVLTTNYDDWYASLSCNKPRVLGRSVRDCQRVLSSLTTSTAPILWALQGFLGGQATPPYPIPPDKAAELARQVVVGHHHYQSVINTEPHFRRAFADVFRRRSLLFLGSGLTEDYLINLFSEILPTYGPGPLPHYAMFNEEEARRHGDFLQGRLNVTPIVFKGHEELPRLLDALASACSAASLSLLPAARLDERFLLSGAADPPARLVLRWGGLPHWRDGQCVAFSVGRDGDRLKLGGQGHDYLNRHYPAGEEAERKFVRVSEFIYQFGSEPVFAVAARTEPADARDLRRIAPSIRDLLGIAADKGKQMVLTGLIAAGSQRKWHPVFSLIEMLRGARIAARALGGKCPSLIVNIIDPAVWFQLQARKINVEDILSSPNLRFWAEVRPRQGRTAVCFVSGPKARALGQSPAFSASSRTRRDGRLRFTRGPRLRRHPRR